MGYNRAMRTLLMMFIAGSLSALIACTGDCMTCHPGLMPTINEDMRHKPMLTCINCHSAEPNAMAECGSDCFACHPVERIEQQPVAEHGVIRKCRDCHMAMKEALLDISTPKDQSPFKPLKELLAE